MNQSDDVLCSLSDFLPVVKDKQPRMSSLKQLRELILSNLNKTQSLASKC